MRFSGHFKTKKWLQNQPLSGAQAKTPASEASNFPERSEGKNFVGACFRLTNETADTLDGPFSLVLRMKVQEMFDIDTFPYDEAVKAFDKIQKRDAKGSS